MNVIILGPPGSGKGTQAEKLAERFNLFYVSSGNLTRELSKGDQRIRTIMEKGGLIPSKEMSDYVFSFLDKNVPQADNIIFDGYPRQRDQYEKLKHWLNQKGKIIDLAILLELSEDEAARRIASRRVCTKCGEVYNIITNQSTGKDCSRCGGKLVRRKDDSDKSVKERFPIYKRSIKGILSILEKEGLLRRVDGNRKIDAIQKDLGKILAEYEGH